jgi:hypothetical protein
LSTRTRNITAEELLRMPSDGSKTSGVLAQERSNWRLLGQGAGIHWPALDEDISVENLLADRASGDSQRSLKRWLSQRTPSGS